MKPPFLCILSPAAKETIVLEPEISRTLPSDRRILSSYSSEHPWMFTVATGVRINLGK